jgi:hypothetical protein
MNLVIIIGLFSVVCFGQPIDGHWCEKPCDSAVAGKFDYPAPTNRGKPLNKQTKHSKQQQQRVMEQVPQPTIELPPPPVVISTVPIQRFWWLPGLVMVVITFVMVAAVYLITQRRSVTLFTEKYLHRHPTENHRPPHNDALRNAPLGPADLNIAFSVIREFFKHRRL